MFAPPSPVITTELWPARKVSLGVVAVSCWPAVSLAVSVAPVPLPVLPPDVPPPELVPPVEPVADPLEPLPDVLPPVMKSVLVFSDEAATLSMSTTVIGQTPFDPAPGGL